MILEDDVFPRATEPPFLSALHSIRTQQTLLAKDLVSQQKTGKETVQTFSGSI